MASFPKQLSAALRYEQDLSHDTDEQHHQWAQLCGIARIDATRQQRIAAFEREGKILVHSGIRCGD